MLYFGHNYSLLHLFLESSSIPLWSNFVPIHFFKKKNPSRPINAAYALLGMWPPTEVCYLPGAVHLEKNDWSPSSFQMTIASKPKGET